MASAETRPCRSRTGPTCRRMIAPSRDNVSSSLFRRERPAGVGRRDPERPAPTRHLAQNVLRGARRDDQRLAEQGFVRAIARASRRCRPPRRRPRARRAWSARARRHARRRRGMRTEREACVPLALRRRTATNSGSAISAPARAAMPSPSPKAPGLSAASLVEVRDPARGEHDGARRYQQPVGEAAAAVACDEAGDEGVLGAQLLGDKALEQLDRMRRSRPFGKGRRGRSGIERVAGMTP